MRHLLVTCLLCVFDVHLPVLQTFAWTGMFVHNVQQQDVASALRDTFDGDHPCRLCHAIKAAQESTDESLTATPALRCDATLSHVLAGLLPPTASLLPLRALDPWPPLQEGAPPVPPPPDLVHRV